MGSGLRKDSYLQVLLFSAAVLSVQGNVPDSPDLNAVFEAAVGEVSISDVVKTTLESGLNQSCFQSADGYNTLRACLRSQQCVSRDDVARLYNTTADTQLPVQQVLRAAPGLLYLLTQEEGCSTDTSSHQQPTTAAIWGYSFLFVTLINACSLFGALVLPCVRLRVYKLVLMFMVSLAVGTLVGSGLLVLIPEALELHTDDLGFLWKMTTVMGGIYIFFLVERIMRIINAWKEDSKEKKEQDERAMEGTFTSSFQTHSPENPHSRLKDLNNVPDSALTTACTATDGAPRSTSSVQLTTDDGNADRSTLGQQRVRIAPVAYMIIFGDALHNLIDGLSIGAAFTDSTLLGISVSVAVICEELPHELGDFAILLNSGMTVRKALMYNFLSSLSCYVGLVIGILLGENTSANTWIFAIAGGMFLYISLADMLPEMNSSAESEDGKEFGMVKTFLLQNFGLLFGFGIILVLAVYGGDINFE